MNRASTTKAKRKASKWVGEAQTYSHPNNPTKKHPRHGNPQSGSISTIRTFPSEARYLNFSSLTFCGFPGCDPHWFSKPQNVNDENLLLKGCTNLTALGSSNKTPVGKSPRLYVKETHLLILKQILERQEFIRTLSWDRSTGRYHFWYFIQACNICSDRHILDLSH